jgi:hypothetical protein
MLTFDTGSSWGTEKTTEELRQERQERQAELDRIEKEEKALKKKRQAEKEAQWAREAEAAEKENLASFQKEQDENRRQAKVAQEKKKADIQASNKNMTEVQKMEAALAAVKKEKQERSNAMQRAARSSISNTGSSSSGGTSSGRSTGSSYEAPKPRGRVRVNPVTGALMAVEDNPNDGKVQEGCLRLDKKYMSAALAAGLGGGKGMYGHIGSIQKQFTQKNNTGGRPRNGPSYGREAAAASTGRATGKGSMSRVKVENGIATITSKTSNPSRRKLKQNPNFNRKSVGACDLGGNPIRGDQKRKGNGTKNVKRITGRGTAGKASSGSYMKSKGVVATLGGASSGATRRYQDKKAQEKEAARQSERMGDRKKPAKSRRQASGGTLGGGSSAPKGDAAAMRAARLAALEKRGIK